MVETSYPNMSSRNSEPYFDDRLVSITGQSSWSKEDEIIWNQTHRQSDKHVFYQHAYEFISDNCISGDYHEFGCHKCRTFRMAMLEASRHFLDDMKFYAYDSFEGLPSTTAEHGLDERWTAGQLSTSLQDFRSLITSSGFSLNNVIEIVGFYHDTLCNKEYIRMHEGSKAALITIDCDLYESAVPVFTFIENLVQEGTILYIDDYFTGYKGNPLKGVSRALDEWSSSSSWKLVDYRDVGWAGKSFIVYQ